MLSKKSFLFAICCLLLGLAAALLASRARSYLTSESFNYDVVRKDEKIQWSGPKEGEKIDLSKFRTERGESFPQFAEKTLILLSVVDPKCEMCSESADLIEQVQTEAKAHQIKFFVVSFVPDIPKVEFFRFAKILCNPEESYLWQGEKQDIMPALRKMVVPSSLLINENGTVLRRFPGGSRSKSIRDQMASQIISETLQEKANLE